MRRTRSILICTALFLVLLSVNPVAAGGGGSAFAFNRRWFAPGQVAVGRTQFTTDANNESRELRGEPYFAYLLPGQQFIEPPHIPANAIRLARVRMRWLDSGMWDASVRFVIPRVPPGSYAVSLCNDPCRNTVVGDLMGGWISVAASAEQAKFRNLEARIEERVLQQMWDATAGFQEQIDALREQPPSTSVGTDLRLTTIEDQVERLNAQVRNLEGGTDEGLMAWLWLAGWILAATIAVAWWKSRSLRGAEPPEDPASGGERATFRTSSEASTRIPGASRAERVGSAAT
ncbi:MAG: hypothetical protein ACRDHO_04905 [Actinomycetota bacterium]